MNKLYRVGEASVHPSTDMRLHVAQRAIAQPIEQCSLELFPEPSPILSFKPVSHELSLGDERFFIVVAQGDRTWRYPLQFAEWEIPIIGRYIWRWDWRLGDEDCPIKLGEHHRKMQLLSNRVLLATAVTGGAS